MIFIVYRGVSGQVSHRVEIEAQTTHQALAIFDRFSVNPEEDAWEMARTAGDEQQRDEQHRLIPRCVGCGQCCQGRCTIGGLTFPDQGEGPCPSLVWDENANRHWCQILLDAEEPHKTYMMKLLGCGLAQGTPIEKGCQTDPLV